MADRPPPQASLPDWLPRLAHDLRNPVTPMRSAVQLLQLGQLPPEVAPDLLRTLDRQIDYLLRQIDDVSDLVKIERGGFAMQPTTCDLVAIVSAALARHARHARAGAGQAAPVDVDAAEPLRVRADEVRLRQLLDTVLGIPGSGAPSPTSVEVVRDADQAVVRLRVAGRGAGGNECLAYLASGVTPDDASSLTFGCLVARRILELHGGSLSLAEDGAVVEVRLPLVDG